MVGKPKVYLETSVLSYLTARPSRDIIVAAHQQTTAEWWQRHRTDFELVASQLVVQEASAGDPEAAAARLRLLDGVELLAATDAALSLARELIEQRTVPRKAAEDALHIAIAVTNGVDYLLTWNYKHLANARMRTGIERVCRQQGFEPSIICSPEALLEE
jgi:predicted nucleic acid-binding protein